VAGACGEIFRFSPDSCNGAWGLVFADALMPAVLPAEPVVTPPPPDVDDGRDEDPAGTEDVGTASGSIPGLASVGVIELPEFV
jgi:hypothetical protein